MTRDMRFRFAGTFFYVFLLANIIATREGWTYLRQLFALDGGSAAAIVPIVALGAALLSSDVLGYFLGTIVWESYRSLGGFAKKWRYLKIKPQVLDQLTDHAHAAELKEIDEDVYFSYFWQQAAQGCVDWASRKHVTFFTNWSVVLAIAAGYFLSLILCTLYLHPSWWHPVLFGIAGLFSALLAANARAEWRAMKQFVDLYFLGCRDERVTHALKQIDRDIG